MTHITERQRYEISVLLQAGQSKSYIAKKLNVHLKLLGDEQVVGEFRTVISGYGLKPVPHVG